MDENALVLIYSYLKRRQQSVRTQKVLQEHLQVLENSRSIEGVLQEHLQVLEILVLWVSRAQEKYHSGSVFEIYYGIPVKVLVLALRFMFT